MATMGKFRDLQVIIPLAGEGKRFSDAGFQTIKPLIPVKGIPMIKASVDSLNFGEASYHFVVRKSNSQDEFLFELLKSNYAKSSIRSVQTTTAGPAITCLIPVFDLDFEKPLVIANCDQIMKWNSRDFLDFCFDSGADGTIVTYDANVPHNSYAKLDDKGLVTCVREKEVISNISLNGIHFWKKASYFFKSTCRMIAENDRAPNGEFYVGPSYNHMIKEGFKVKNYHLKDGQHWPVGVPADLERYLCEAI